MTAKLPVFLFLLYPITKIMKECLREKKRKTIERRRQEDNKKNKGTERDKNRNIIGRRISRKKSLMKKG